MPKRLFLDFGTAYCKAATCEPGAPPVALAIGEAVHQDSSDRHMIPTALFVAQSGRVCFGEAAVRAAGREGRLPYGDIKDALTKAETRTALNELLGTEYNQASVQLTVRDATTLFLAFFTQAALQVDDGPDRKVRRSIGMPVFEMHKQSWVSDELAEGLAHAHVLAQQFGDDLFRSIDLRDALRVLRDARNAEPSEVVVRPPTVPEPIAAVAAHLLHFTPDTLDKKKAGLMMVVDVGAGTTDIAMFATGQVEGKATVRHVERSKKSLDWAGRAVDRALVDHLDSRDGGDQLRASIERGVEVFKQDLFRDGEIKEPIRCSLEDFLQCDGMSKVVDNIRGGFEAVLHDVDRSFFKRKVVVRLSGGGHDLPFLSKLAKDQLLQPDPLKKPTQVQMAKASPQPLWQHESGYSRLYEDVGDKFHRLSVALGGAYYCAEGQDWLLLEKDMPFLLSQQGPTRPLASD